MHPSMASHVQLQPRALALQPVAPGDQPTISTVHRVKGGESHVMRCLLIRHLPSWLNREEKESLFSHFGAQDVVIMPNRGKLRNCVFAAFADHDKAKKAMEKLHQLDVFGSRLVVEYANTSHSSVVHKAKLDKWSCNTCKDELEDEGVQVKEEEAKEKEKRLPPITKQEVSSPPSSSQRYRYPLPTPSTIANITNAIACVPQLYVQVLHLMNKLNLPPPFGPPMSAPPMLLEGLGFPPELEGQQPQTGSSDEDSSEIESDEETRRKRKSRMREPHLAMSPKRRKVPYKQVVGAVPPPKRRRVEESGEEDVKPIITQSKKIEFHMPTELAPSQPMTTNQEKVTVAYMARTERRQNPSNSALIADDREPAAPDQQYLQGHAEATALGSAKVPPVDATIGGGAEVQGEEGEEEESEVERFITLAELTANRLSDAEMKDEHIFRNYSPGEPSVRLYLKNVAKQVEDKDLRYIYGRYVNWSVEKETNMFSIQLMKTGRMKGQAFIGLPSEAVAAQALRETNGYLLRGKPIVMHFARSSRPKDTGV